MKGPTKRQEELMRFMRDYHAREGLPPTLMEMREFLAVRSPTAPLDMLKQLERKGYVLRKPRVSRGSVLTYKGAKFLGLAEGKEST